MGLEKTITITARPPILTSSVISTLNDHSLTVTESTIFPTKLYTIKDEDKNISVNLTVLPKPPEHTAENQLFLAYYPTNSQQKTLADKIIAILRSITGYEIETTERS